MTDERAINLILETLNPERYIGEKHLLRVTQLERKHLRRLIALLEKNGRIKLVRRFMNRGWVTA